MKEDVIRYIDSYDGVIHSRLLAVRKCLIESAGACEEGIAYGIPYIAIGTKKLMFYGGAKQWIALYPFPDTLKAFSERLSGYSLSSGTIRFLHKKEIDFSLISDIAAYRKEQVES